MLPPTSYERARAQAAREFSYAWLLVAIVTVLVCSAGATFGWIKYFSDDDFAPQFDMIRKKDAALQAAITAEQEARIAEDIVLTTEQEATQVALDLEITTRTEEDALLLSLVLTENDTRTAAQATLNNGIDAEVAAREAFDTWAFARMANLTLRLDILTAYDIYAQQQFTIKMAALTALADELAAEIAARIAADVVLTAQDIAQQAFIALFSTELAAETAARIAEDMAQMAAIAAILGDGILTINNQSSLNHNFDFISANSGFTIGSGGTNIITITNNAIVTVDGVTPDPSTFDISILADNNVVLTTTLETHNLNFALGVVPMAPNYASYRGSWVGLSGDCRVPEHVWIFDAFDILAINPCSTSPLILNYNTFNNLPWEVPLSGGVGYGVWLVRIRMVLTINYLGTPYGKSFTMGVCVDTYTNCVFNPSSNEPQATLNWQEAAIYPTGDFASWGMNYQDHAMKTTYVFDGRGAAPTTGVYPVWYNAESNSLYNPTIQNAFLVAISIEFDVTQLA